MAHAMLREDVHLGQIVERIEQLLDRVAADAAPAPGSRASSADPADMLTVREVAAKLKISARTVRRLINAGELRAISIETTRMRFYRVSRQALKDFIDHAEAAAGLSRNKPVSGLVDVPNRNY